MASQYSSRVVGAIGFGSFVAGSGITRLLVGDVTDLARTRRGHPLGWGVAWDSNHDRRHETCDPLASWSTEGKSRHYRTIVLVRHGQYQCEGAGFPAEEKRLTTKGRQQAVMAGRWLKSVYGKRIVKVSSSDMLRAEETARVIADQTGHALDNGDSRLRECCPAFPEPCYHKKCQESYKRYAPDQPWHTDLVLHANDLDSAWDAYFYRPMLEADSGQVHVIVCHANVMRYLACRAIQGPPERWNVMPHIGHCHYVIVKVFGDGRTHLSAIDEGSHIPLDCRTHSNLKGVEPGPTSLTR